MTKITTTYERTVTSGEFPYDEKSNAVMKMKIDGSVMFLAIVEGVLTEDYGDGEVYEYDLTENSGETCVAMVNKGRFDFSGDNWNGMHTTLGIQWLIQSMFRVGATMNSRMNTVFRCKKMIRFSI